MLNSIFGCNEAHYHLNGSVNKQNCRYWSPKGRTHVLNINSLHSQKVKAWCTLSGNGIME